MKKRIEIDFNKEYESKNCGKFKIIEELPTRRMGTGGKCVKRFVRIKFVDTGYETDCQLLVAMAGNVKDPYYANIAGIGYLGDVPVGNINKRIYDIWYRMLKRCYNPNDKMYKFYGALGVTVCERWYCFANFLNDIIYIPNFYYWYNYPGKYEFDKDSLQEGVPTSQKVYSPETCQFILTEYNSKLSAVTKHNNVTTSEYYGLYATPYGTYQCTITIDGKKYFLGTYRNEIAAANVYNFVSSRCALNALLNNVPNMDIHECMKYLTGRKTPHFPPNIKASEIEGAAPTNVTSQYNGVYKRGNNYGASYCIGTRSIGIGTFDDEIAAASAHNIWNRIYNGGDKECNNLENEMTIGEVLSHKVYRRGSDPVEMCRIVEPNGNIPIGFAANKTVYKISDILGKLLQ